MQHCGVQEGIKQEQAAGGPIPEDWARLIRKLRWIGMEEEAERLEFAVSTLPPGRRGSVCCGPFNTD